MGKIVCTCGHIIVDQSDFIKHKAHIIADQDYFDLFDEIENKEWNDLSARAAKYFNEVFQCGNCSNIIILRGEDRFDFLPLNKELNSNILTSYLGQKWLGTMSANFRNGQGEIFWNTNLENGVRENLTLEELEKLYNQKFRELTDLKILRHSFLRVDGIVKHNFKHNE